MVYINRNCMRDCQETEIEVVGAFLKEHQVYKVRCKGLQLEQHLSSGRVRPAGTGAGFQGSKIGPALPLVNLTAEARDAAKWVPVIWKSR
jgi:hypothetical protein